MRNTLLLIAALLVIGLALPTQAGTAAEDQTGIPLFDSLWGTEQAMADIRYSDGVFYVCVEVFDHGEEWTEWYYRCGYDAETETLKSDDQGVKQNCFYDDMTDTVTITREYENGSAAFSIDENGRLIWNDRTEDAGRVFCLTKMGRFEGNWECKDVSITFDAYEGFYRCTIIRNDGQDKTTEWTCFCLYDPKSSAAVSDSVSKAIYAGDSEEDGEDIDCESVYEDGTAVFAIDGNGCLIWKDPQENTGDGCAFVRVTVDEPFWKDVFGE